MESGWAILELMGHRRLAGWLSEEEVAGAAFLRLDIPAVPDGVKTCDECGAARAFGCICEPALGPLEATQFYAPGALYCLTPTTEEIARGMAASLRPQPVHRWELPAPAVEAKPAAAYEPRPDDDCECGHERDDHQELGANLSGEVSVWGSCKIPGCDCTEFDAAIPF